MLVGGHIQGVESVGWVVCKRAGVSSSTTGASCEQLRRHCEHAMLCKLTGRSSDVLRRARIYNAELWGIIQATIYSQGCSKSASARE